MHADTSALDAFVGALSAVGAGSEIEARSQVFKPTCCPESLQIVPGVVLNKPLSFDYAPDIEAAHSKVKSMSSLASAGRVSVLNITMEPGSGKTLHLPFRFTDTKSLVVLPALFDAWSAHLASKRPSNITTFSFDSGDSSSVTYTDSYYAAYLLSTGKITKYNIVFVDESHSTEGVTTFMASACVPGVTFVRMTATPESVNTAPRKAFPVTEERAAPELSDVNAVASFVNGRPEKRKLVMAPSAESASLISRAAGSALLLTPQSPFDVLHGLLNEQTAAVTIVTDSTCARSINLNLEFVLDFGKTSTPTGTRDITIPEQQQRKYRVGRNKPGVYCCPMKARSNVYVDQFSIFRNNLWLKINSLDTFPCDFPDVDTARAMHLLRSFMEPALVPVEVTPNKRDSSESSFDDARSTTDSVHDGTHRVDVVDMDDGPRPSQWQDGDFPSWLIYYLGPRNHASKYVGDIVHDHRKLPSDSVFVGGDVYLSQAPNRLSVEYRPQSPESVVSSERRNYSDVGGNRPVVIRRYSTAESTKTRPRSDKLERKYTSALGTEFTDGGPMSINRQNRTKGSMMGTAYKALSISGDYLVECGLILTSSGRMEDGLSPLPAYAMRAVNASSAARDRFRATHYLTWTVVKDLGSVDLALAKAESSSVGAWSPPPVNEIPKIDLQTEYHSMWKDVLTTRVRDKMTLPVIIPRVGWARRALRTREQGNPLDVALDYCEEPTYTVSEQQAVHRAWNVLAMRSASVAACSDAVYSDASILLAYMVSADVLSDV